MEKKSIYCISVTIFNGKSDTLAAFYLTLGDGRDILLSSAKMQYFSFIESFGFAFGCSAQFELRDSLVPDDSATILCLVKNELVKY